ncbi:hypothetical protein LCGC14_0688370 [marine sediment metagenome]|uniref:DNA methylase N-4/N-6 domain-containing protein n=1 Tax=marine sediment metagenome TaxID=412755 RepID=A0A0F9QR25_9ZZZZ
MDWNKIKYIDCLDEDEGLPSLPDKSVDLAFTDPPWGLGYDYKTHIPRDIKKNTAKRHRKHRINYKDEWNPEWNLKWFHELERICNNIILVLGRLVYMWWIRNTEPVDMYIRYYKNGRTPSKISISRHWRPLLVYGKLHRNKPVSDVMEGHIRSGFLADKRLIHPSMKDVPPAYKLLKALKPKSLIDPFVGSGTFIYAAHMLNIPWIGYEIEPKYKHDVDLRFQLNHDSPRSISHWFGERK